MTVELSLSQANLPYFHHLLTLENKNTGPNPEKNHDDHSGHHRQAHTQVLISFHSWAFGLNSGSCCCHFFPDLLVLASCQVSQAILRL